MTNLRRPPPGKSIVNVATQVTQKLVDNGSPVKSTVLAPNEAPGAVVDKDKLDIEQILSVPNYIYFEEHHTFDSYVRPNTNKPKRVGLKEIKLSDLVEERKNEAVKIGKRFMTDDCKDDDTVGQENVRPFGLNVIKDFNSVIGHNSQMCQISTN